MATAALTGTFLGGVTEAVVVAGGRTIAITLTGDTWIPSGTYDWTTQAYGPQASLVPPLGAVPISPGSSIQAATTANPAGTTFKLVAGVHTLSSAIQPKSGNVYFGEYGAILDGTGWTPSDETQAAFRAGTGITDVTITNLVIRNFKQRAIYANFPEGATGWIVDYNEIDTIDGEGVVLASHSFLRHNYIHDCIRSVVHPILENGGGYVFGGGNYPDDVVTNITVEYNHFADVGRINKGLNCTQMKWRYNWFERSGYSAIWNDGVGTGLLAEYNLIEDCSVGIFFELSISGTMRYNTIRRSSEAGIFLSTSRDCDVHDNVLEDNVIGLTLFANLPAIGQGWPWTADLRNNAIHDNTTTTRGGGHWAVAFSYASGTTAPITSIVRSSNVVTVTTSVAHGMLAEMTVTIAGVANSAFNGEFVIASRPSPTSLTYNQTGTSVSSAGGTTTPSITPYRANTKNNQLYTNSYRTDAAALAAWAWYWDGSKNQSLWQALPQDADGTFTAI